MKPPQGEFSMSLREKLLSVRVEFLEDLRKALSVREVEELQVRYLGKKGVITSFLIELKQVPSEEKPHLGKLVNDLKQECVAHVEASLLRLEKEELQKRLAQETLDPTLPGRRPRCGKRHPIQQTLDEIVDILVHMGFSVRLGPDLDTDYYNFEGLNFPPDHPARDMQDTFYFTDDLLLRTHTSNVQVHALETLSPPVRIVAPGRCFRNEEISSRSHVFFHQIEGFYVDTNVSFTDLLSTMEIFLQKLFGKEAKTRFRPSYFPFVEPGMEVDVSCTSCHGKGCRLCKHTGWLEILGAGMIHPNVLQKANIDPEKYSGYAWGMGIERILLLRSGISDIRILTENDDRFLRQFPG